MRIVEKDGNKRYRFEDADLLMRRNFEKMIGMSNPDVSNMILNLLEEIQTRRSESWRNAIAIIREIDPDISEDAEFGYNAGSGEFTLHKSEK